jgi:bifunctional DNA-binding transcriptional regulator/antitoxin component of YhaV-PrlF toxin-antitoxin module
MSQQQTDKRVGSTVRTVQERGEVTLPKEWRDRHDARAVRLREQKDGALIVEPL